MAKIHQEREDLLREGTAMPIRGRIRWTASANNTPREYVLGWRRDGSFSCFCDQDPVFHFNAHQQLRRVFLEGMRYSCENTQLLQLQPVQGQESRLQFERIPVEGTRQHQILERWNSVGEHLSVLARSWPGPEDHESTAGQLECRELECEGTKPDDFMRRLLEWLASVQTPPELADRL